MKTLNATNIAIKTKENNFTYRYRDKNNKKDSIKINVI